MKSLNIFINEKLHVSKVSNLKKPELKYFPENREELDELLKKLFEERGPNADLNDIDVSKINDFDNLFDNENFDGKLGDFRVEWWDVSNMQTGNKMFKECSKFDCNLAKWDVSKCENFARMFYYCKNFTGLGLDEWNTESGKYMTSMFCHCDKFDQDLSKWNLSNCVETSSMFAYCRIFKGNGLEKWDMSKVHSIFKMFSNCYKLRVNLDNWKLDSCEFASKKELAFEKCSNMKKLPEWYKKIYK